MFELGTHKSKLWRSSKDEWFGGTEGFYWGCNNGKDLDVRLETVASVEGKPANLVWRASDRDKAWLSLFHEAKGKINADFGFKAFTTPPLASSRSLDAKFTTSGMAKELEDPGPCSARRSAGPGSRSEAEKRVPGIRPLVPNDWTVPWPRRPARGPRRRPGRRRPGRQASRRGRPGNHDDTPPPGTGPSCPRIRSRRLARRRVRRLRGQVVSMEKAAGETAQEKVELALYGARTRYLAATRRLGKDVPLSKIEADPSGSPP